ncbi:MAG: hypothetical protein DLM63_11745 [Solirubrobacterales bacterium]|nr:MAG: hypothetical protein DLM63_11745 [Solirubrobacterales bacterium]
MGMSVPWHSAQRFDATIASLGDLGADEQRVVMGNLVLSVGDEVVLRPSERRDISLAGRWARIERILIDYIGSVRIAISLADAHERPGDRGRVLVVAPEELEPSRNS